MKIVQINGFRGLVVATFMCICLFAGFVIFPGQVAMFLWNKYLAPNYMLPILNVFQGVLLWGMIAVSYVIVTKKDFAVSFKEAKNLSDSEFDMIMRRANTNKFRAINNLMRKSDFEMIEQSIKDTIAKAQEIKNAGENTSHDDNTVSHLK